MLNEFCLFELILCVFESCQVGFPGLKSETVLRRDYCVLLKDTNRSSAAGEARAGNLRSRVKHSTI